jgi:hypothetical protein
LTESVTMRSDAGLGGARSSGFVFDRTGGAIGEETK